jgi:hypothetical protein
VSEAERIREKIAYCKLLLGLTFVPAISLIGWLVAGRDPVSIQLSVASWGLVVLLIFLVFLLHRQVDRLINQTGKLRKWKRSTRSSCSLPVSRSL